MEFWNDMTQQTQLVTDLLWTCYGQVANLLRTCYGETGIMDFGLKHTYYSIGILVVTEGNIDVLKYSKILKANWKPIVAKHFLKRPIICVTKCCDQHTAGRLHKSGQLLRKFLVRPGQQSLDMNITENVQHTIKLKLQSDWCGQKILCQSTYWIENSTGNPRQLQVNPSIYKMYYRQKGP